MPLPDDFLRELVAQVTDGITVQQGAKLVYANDAAARLSGFDGAGEFLAAPASPSRSWPSASRTP